MKRLFLFIFPLLLFCSGASAQVLLSEGFEGAAFVPAGWQNNYIVGFGTTVRWDRVASGTSPTVLPHSGGWMARFDCRTASSGYIVNLVTPALSFSSGGPYRVRFWLYRGDQVPLGPDELRVYVNTTTATNTATELSRFLISRVKDPSEAANGWYEYIYEIPVSYSGATNYIIFNANSRNYNNNIYLDDVVVEASSCLRPAAPGYSGLTTNSFQLNWGPPVSGSPAGYDYEIRTAGSCGTGPNGLTLSGSVLAPATTVPVTGLQEGYQYRLCVRSDCGADSSMWNYPVTVVTPCNPVPIPYTENFDGVITGTGLPPCIKLDNADGADSWRMNTYYYDATYTASAPRAIFTSSSGTSFGQPGQDWFFTAPLLLEAGKCYQLGFAYRTNGGNESFEVKMGTAPAGASMSTPIFSRTSFTVTTYQQQTNMITVGTTGTYYVGFRCVTNQSLGGGIFIDNISMTEICGAPAALQVNNVSLSGVTFQWSAPGCGTPSGYEWELRTAGAAGSGNTGLAESGTTGAGVVTATTGALVNGTTYTLYVRSQCSPGVYSNWIGGYTFKACGTTALPYFENFDNVVAPALPDCYTIENINGGATWEMRQNIQPYSAPNCMSYTSWATSAVGNDWLYTPPFALTAGTTYRLSFYYGARSTGNIEKLEVKAGVATNATAMTSPVLYSNNAISNPVLNQAIVDFTPATTANYHIGFHALSAGPQFFLKLDDINFSVAPLCDSVKQVRFINVSPYNATAQWQAPMVNTASSYSWELRSSGAPGSGPAGLEQSGTLAAGSLSLSLSGLLPAQAYTLYIRSSCGAVNGDWVAAPFTSSCLPVTPDYSENFDGVTGPASPPCTKVESINKDISWEVRGSAPGTAHSSPNILFYYFNPFMPADDWFYTAPLQLAAGNTYRLTFFYRAESATYTEALEVKLGSYAQPSAMTTLLYSNTNIRNESFQRVSMEFTVPSAGTFYLGFRCMSIVNQAGVWLDDISVRSLGKCGSAPLVIQAGRTGSSYQWEINTGSGFVSLADNAQYSGATTATLTITGVPTSYAGYQYRCLVDGIPADPFTLKFAAIWAGGTDTNWHNGANWGSCGQLPDQYTDVYIPSGKARYPGVSTNTSVRSLTADPGASVTVQTNVLLLLLNQ